MTTFRPAFRMRLYAQRSVDPTETTVLTPASGAPHSDAFQIATVAGLSGYQPLMGIPEGRRGRFDPLTRRVEHGTLRVPLYDFRVTPGGIMSDRWGTAFAGDTTGRPQPIGCLAVIEWDPSTGWGGTPSWSAYWKGPVQDFELEGEQVIALVVKDMAARFNYEIGVARPHASATSVVVPSVLPYGLTADYGTLKAYSQRGQLTGKVKTGANGYRYIEVDSASISRPDNVITAEMRARMRVLTGSLPIPIGGVYTTQGGMRLHFSSSSPSIADKELQATVCDTTLRGNGKFAATRLYCVALDSSDPFYQAFDSTSVPDNTVVSFDIRRNEEPTYFVGGAAGIDPVDFLADIAAGYHSDLAADGTPKRGVATNAASFAAVSAAVGRYPVWRQKAPDYVEKYLCQPSDLGYRFNESGELVVFSTQKPTSAGSLPAITDADIFADPAPHWIATQQGAVTKYVLKGYQETLIDVGPALKGGEDFPDLPSGGVQWQGEATQYDLIVAPPDDADLDLEERVQTIDCLGYRFMPGEQTAGIDRAEWIRRRQIDLARQFYPMFSDGGVQRLQFRARRTANTTGLYPGGWALVNLTLPINPGTNTRGGQRLMQCTDRSEDADGISFELVDAGAGTVANVPTAGASPAQEAGNTKYGATWAVTLNAQSDPVEVWVNLTATSVGTRPADSDAGWHPVQPAANVGTSELRVLTSATHTFHPLASGKRAWFRQRSAPDGKMPSGWVYPGTTGYVDLATVATPTGAAVTSITAKAARFSWTNTDSNSPVAILLGHGATGAAANASTPAQVITLPPGTTFYDFTGLDANYGGDTYFRPQVCYVDAVYGLGPVAGIAGTSFQATGTAATAPDMAGIVVLRGGGTSAPQSPNPGVVVVAGSYGAEVELIPGPASLGYDIEVRLGTTSGALSLYDTVQAEDVQGRGYVYRVALPNDGVTRYMDARLVGPGVSAGSYCAEVSFTPGWLPPVAFGVSQGQAIVGQGVPLYLIGGRFQPEKNTSTYDRANGYMAPNVVGSTVNYWLDVPVPRGATITGITLYGYRTNAGDIVTCSLYTVSTAGVSSLALDTRTLSGTGTNLSDSTAVPYALAVSLEFVTLKLQLKCASALTDAGCYGVLVTYKPNDYTQ